MNNEYYCNIIGDGLARLVSQVRQSVKPNLRSINIHAESFFREFLNMLFGWNLRNANARDQNALGIDLLYPAENIVVQVSSTTTHEKIQSSLKKSQNYSKAHFIFVAIDDHLPSYKKEFNTYGLEFIPTKDILDTTRLFHAVVHCEDRGQFRAIDIQRILADLVKAYFYQEDRRNDLKLRPLGSGRASTIFAYNANVVPLFGREQELDELWRYVTGNPDQLFCWWALTGPGGSGKTRLAYELQNKLLCGGEWDVFSIPSSVLSQNDEKLLEISEACPGRTLLIVDYAQQYIEKIKRIIECFSDPTFVRVFPLRLLLLERDVRDEEGRIVWFDKIEGTNHYVRDTCYIRHKAKVLNPLSVVEKNSIIEDPLEKLIRSFADWRYNDCTNKCMSVSPMPKGKEQYLRKKLEEIDPSLLRPLFAMILADAWIQDPKTERWTQEKLLSYIVDKEWSMVAMQLAPFHNSASSLLRQACQNLWRIATVLGADDQATSCDKLKRLLPKDWEILSRGANDYKDKLESRTLDPLSTLLVRSGLCTDDNIKPFKPDLLGEYFVVSSLELSGKDERKSFLEAVLRESTVAEAFFSRVLFDFEPLLLNEPDILSVLFPADPDIDIKLLVVYGRFLRQLYDHSLSKKMREWLATQLAAFASNQPSRNARTALICNEAASVMQSMGKYLMALQLFEKALEIVETTSGLEHPDTAMIYNNIGLIYHSMSNYPEALRYFGKALKIRAQLFGENHLSTATTYNNIGAVYCSMGNYTKALEYYDKDRVISETLLGAKHPSTATSYNNMAVVYRSMGDYNMALKYYRKALEIRESKQGPDTATTYGNIANAYEDMGDYMNALEYNKKALLIRESVLGVDHIDTATTYNQMASIYKNIGNYSEALIFFEKALGIREKLLGFNHPSTATIYNNIAVVYKAIGKYQMAIHYYNQALSIRESVLGINHPSTAITYNNLAIAYELMGNYQKAIELNKKAMKIAESTLGRSHTFTATTWHTFSKLCYDMQNLETAIQYSNQALEVFSQILGPEHKSTIVVKQLNDALKKEVEQKQ